MRTVKVPNGNSGVTIPGEPELGDEEVVIAVFMELIDLLDGDELVEVEEEDDEETAELLVVATWESTLSTLELAVVVLVMIVVVVVLELGGASKWGALVMLEVLTELEVLFTVPARLNNTAPTAIIITMPTMVHPKRKDFEFFNLPSFKSLMKNLFLPSSVQLM